MNAFSWSQSPASITMAIIRLICRAYRKWHRCPIFYLCTLLARWFGEHHISYSSQKSVPEHEGFIKSTYTLALRHLKPDISQCIYLRQSSKNQHNIFRYQWRPSTIVPKSAVQFSEKLFLRGERRHIAFRGRRGTRPGFLPELQYPHGLLAIWHLGCFFVNTFTIYNRTGWLVWIILTAQRSHMKFKTEDSYAIL